jgi:LysR family transcriptional regulator, transcriptional activator of nhaA
LRRSLDRWFGAEGIRPIVRGEFGDSDRFDVFAQKGIGFFALPNAVEAEALQGSGTRLLGRIDFIRERF